jgi:DNA-binding FadR family transcriptional regulator
VSRAVLREAVRLLEHHAVARMRRGPGGGLVVTEPDPVAAVEAMALYLDYRKAGLADLRVAREALELGCVELAVRQTSPDTATRLERSLVVHARTTEAEIRVLAHDLHIEIAEVSGNPTLAVFVKVLTSMWNHYLTAHPDETPPIGDDDAEVADSVVRAHRAIVDAIVAGDQALARHRMLRHLEALLPWRR